MILCCFFFFFSSRRRHTRFDCDWSSDVCSSDLQAIRVAEQRTSGEIRVSVAPLFWGNVKKAADNAFVRMGMTVTKERKDRKSTRLNSSHSQISYAVFCLKKKKKKIKKKLKQRNN